MWAAAVLAWAWAWAWARTMVDGWPVRARRGTGGGESCAELRELGSTRDVNNPAASVKAEWTASKRSCLTGSVDCTCIRGLRDVIM